MQRGPSTGVKPDGGRRRTGIFRCVSRLPLTADRRIPVRRQVFRGAFPFRWSSIFRRTAPTLTSSDGDRFGSPLRWHRKLYRRGCIEIMAERMISGRLFDTNAYVDKSRLYRNSGQKDDFQTFVRYKCLCGRIKVVSKQWLKGRFPDVCSIQMPI